jgi:hypothetical protein
MRLLVALIPLLIPLTSHAVFKCTERGVTVFQDAPCTNGGGEIRVKPASGHAPLSQSVQSQPSVGASNDPVASLKRVQGERRVTEIGYEIKASERRIEDARERMDAEIATARESKRRANNNLAGATWEQSLSAEMQAATSRFQAVADAENVKIKSLKDERTKVSEGR